ncbi:MAG: enoyl-CoA hydratase-related protein [Gammaproteobacteria bacterium]|nr:enoyl-CoA hydratase-related protein [Gammaproteobacteria bacterium]
MENQHTVLEISHPIAGIAQLSLNRPDALNSLNAPLMKKLEENFQSLAIDKNVKGILLTGNGRAFCAGADIHALADLNSQSGLFFAQNGQKIFRMLETLNKPSLAAIHGAALGGGCELAMAATLRIAADNAIFGQPEVRLGVIPGFGGTQRLSRLIGKGRALELCLTGRKMTAAEALACGLVSEVVPADQLNTRALALLQSIIRLAPAALRSIISCIDYGYNVSLDEAFAMEAAHFGLCCATRDKQEGVKAFLEKREASFAGE